MAAITDWPKRPRSTTTVPVSPCGSTRFGVVVLSEA